MRAPEPGYCPDHCGQRAPASLMAAAIDWACTQSANVRVGFERSPSIWVIASPTVVAVEPPSRTQQLEESRPEQRLSSRAMNWASACLHLSLRGLGSNREHIPPTLATLEKVAVLSTQDT